MGVNVKKWFLGVLSVLTFSASSAYFGDVDLIDGKTLLQNPDAYVVLDVRSAKEYAQGHIKNAINIPHTQVEEHLDKLKTFKDKTIVVHCRSGYRAGKAEDILLANGITNLLHLEGDMLQWQEDKLPLEKSPQ